MAGQREESSLVELGNHGTGIALHKCPHDLVALQFFVNERTKITMTLLLKISF